MKKGRLIYRRPDDPPSFVSCVSLSLVLAVCLFLILLPTVVLFRSASVALLLCGLPLICPCAVLTWRIHRYGFRTTGKPFFNFSLLHLIIIIVAVGIVGMFLSKSKWGAEGAASEGYFASHPVALMIVLALLAFLGCVFASTVSRAAERREWPAQVVNALVAVTAFAVLPCMGFGAGVFIEESGTGFLVLLGVFVATWLGWEFVCWAVGGGEVLRTPRHARRPWKCRVAKAARKRRAPPKTYRPNRSRVYVPHQNHFVKQNRSILP